MTKDYFPLIIGMKLLLVDHFDQWKSFSNSSYSKEKDERTRSESFIEREGLSWKAVARSCYLSIPTNSIAP